MIICEKKISLSNKNEFRFAKDSLLKERKLGSRSESRGFESRPVLDGNNAMPGFNYSWAKIYSSIEWVLVSYFILFCDHFEFRLHWIHFWCNWLKKKFLFRQNGRKHVNKETSLLLQISLSILFGRVKR